MLLRDDGPEPFQLTYVPPSERILSRTSSLLPSVTYILEDAVKVAKNSRDDELSIPGMHNSTVYNIQTMGMSLHHTPIMEKIDKEQLDTIK